MKFEVVGLDYDQRIRCFMVSARADYEWYLNKTSGSEENLEIQRDIIKGTKAYRTLRADLKLGCILPTIVLAARNIDDSPTRNYDVGNLFIEANPRDLRRLQTSIDEATPADIDIIDGLQRTNALRQTLSELSEVEKFTYLARSLRLEIWIGIPFYSLAYRMLLLNAGQRPMSMKHQIDIMSGGLAADLSSISGIDIIKIKDRKRRVRAGQFHLSSLSQAFQAWLQRSPNVDVNNMVVESLVVDEALDSLAVDIHKDINDVSREGFRSFVSWMIILDNVVSRIDNRFFGNDTVVLCFAAAIGFAHRNEHLQARLQNSMQRLIDEAESRPDDPIGISIFEQLRKSIDPKKRNIGEATRDLVFRAVREYILQDGFSDMSTCWTQSASMA